MEHAGISGSEEMPSHDAEGSLYAGAPPGHVEMTVISQDVSTGDFSEKRERPSNETLLSTAFVSFMSFTLCQTVAAVIAGSEAMMGDSAAMFVDALTYLFNLVAERKKNHFDETWHGTIEQDPTRARRIRQRAKRKMILTMELIPPLISVTTLIIVTIFVTRKAIGVLILDAHRDRSKQGDPNINLMLFFSTLNLGLDFMNVFCFAKAKHLLGYETSEGHSSSPSAIGEAYESVDVTDKEVYDETTDVALNGNDPESQSRHEEPESNGIENEINGNGHCSSPDPPGRKGYELQRSSADHMDSFGSSEDEEKDGPNLNMCSAYTHVFADTLRSIAVIIAAGLAELVDGVTPEVADATAAIVVSALILLSLLPLFSGLRRTFAELRAIRAEESSEEMFRPEEANQTNQVV